ncbi:hypothetical protein [Alicyclobacillus fodiniaquatilis]|uniref:DUF4352 domain-containing protein n=1 Tax=Alicyclobacillus fodiniaquatilis TaxID=1661150 RepID=A0ABW4JCN9_9BACL
MSILRWVILVPILSLLSGCAENNVSNTSQPLMSKNTQQKISHSHFPIIFKTDTFTYTVNWIKYPKSIHSLTDTGASATDHAKGKYYMIYMRAKNISSKMQILNNEIYIIAAKKQYALDDKATSDFDFYWINHGSRNNGYDDLLSEVAFDGTISYYPGESHTGYLIFDLPKNTNHIELKVRKNAIDFGPSRFVTVRLQ